MAEVRGGNTWSEELASLVEDTGIRYSVATAAGKSMAPLFNKTGFISDYGGEEEAKTESLKEQVTRLLKSWGEMLLDLGKGCKDIVEQNLITEDSFIVRKVGKPMAKVSNRFKILNELLPEDRDPALAWTVILFVFVLALAGISLFFHFPSRHFKRSSYFTF